MMKPLFPYAGGKARSLKHFSAHLQKTGTYVEPFIGGGAVFCYMHNYGLAERFIINDHNTELTTLYADIKADHSSVLAEAKAIEAPYRQLCERDLGITSGSKWG
ncbi:MAG: DNA adenine methylase, partial [Rhodospirillaceae bacterium]